MKHSLALLLLFISINTYAQDYNFTTDNYDWSETPINYTPTESDLKYSSVVLQSKNIYQYLPDKVNGLVKYRCVHTVILLNDEKSVEDNNKMYFSINDKNAIKQMKTRVIEKGKVISTTGKDDMKVVEEDGNTYLLVAFNGLKKGTILESILIIENSLDLYGSYYIQRNVPVKLSEFQLMAPSHLLFKNKVYNYNTKSVDTVLNEQFISYLRFSDVPAHEVEMNSLGDGNKVRIEYTYFKNTSNNSFYSKFSEVAKNYSEGIFTDYESTNKKLDPILKKLNLTDKSEEEKIFVIENYVKTNYEIKKGIPNLSIPEIIKAKYGNEYSVNRLICYLLKKSDIKFEIVITCSKTDKVFDENFESISYLNNTLFYFPKIDKYLDPEFYLTRIGKVSTDYLGQNAIHTKFIDIGGIPTGVAYIKMIPKNTDEEGTSYETYTMKVNTKESKVNVNFKREMFGYSDQNLRAAYFITNEDKRKEIIEEFVKGMANEGDVKNIKIENYDITNYQQFKAPFLISADVESSHYLEDAGDKLLLNIGEVIGLQQELYNNKPRLYPIDLNFVHLYKRKISLEIPDGYECKGLEKLNMNNVFPDHNKNNSLGFTSRYELKDNILTIYCDEYYKELSYPLSLYENYRTVINSAADFNKISILLEKKQ